MNEKPELLSVVTDPDGEQVYLHADLSGLKKLHSVTDRMISKLESDECDHDHLRTEDWAGHELTTSMLDTEEAKGCTQVHHVKLYGWNPEWKKKQNL